MNYFLYFIHLITQMLMWKRLFTKLVSSPQTMLRFTQEQIQNFLSITHNFVCLILISMYSWTKYANFIPLLCTWSQSYYIFDCFNYQGKKDKTTMILHHLGSVASELYLFTLYYDPFNTNGLAVLWGFFFCELSNYPLYYVYHYTHQVPGELNYVNPIWYIIEGFSFIILRGWIGWYFLWIHPVIGVGLWYIIFTFWLISLYWGWGMIKSFLNKITKE